MICHFCHFALTTPRFQGSIVHQRPIYCQYPVYSRSFKCAINSVTCTLYRFKNERLINLTVFYQICVKESSTAKNLKLNLTKLKFIAA